MDGWQQTTRHAHDEGEDDSAHQQIGRNFKGEGHVGEGLPVHGAGGEAIERQHCRAANGSPHKGDQYGLNQKGEDHGDCAKPQRPHDGDFTPAFGDGGLHGIKSPENCANAHDHSDEAAQNGNKARHHLRLFGVVINFAADIHIETWVLADCVFEILKSVGGR